MHDVVITEPKAQTSHRAVASGLYSLPLTPTIASQEKWNAPSLLYA